MTLSESATHRVEARLAKNSGFWRAQTRNYWKEILGKDGRCIGREPYPFSRERMKPVPDQARENRANSKNRGYVYGANKKRSCAYGSQVVAWTIYLAWIFCSPPIRGLIGLAHMGIAYFNFFGSEEHKEFTAIGDTVNIAQRVESLAGKENREGVLFTQPVFYHLMDANQEVMTEIFSESDMTKYRIAFKGKAHEHPVWGSRNQTNGLLFEGDEG